jgi:7,8-dihydropterin-6-yl-methyl-4-(beta-D-ribofuranosyl)aminobenzene 5'-phosphate synthase
MKLQVLVDSNTLVDRYFYGEPGVSYFIETEGKKILFDVGYSDAFIRNAYKMGIDLYQLDYVALSHGHLDHTWGLEPLIRLYTEAMIEKLTIKTPEIVACSDVFNSRTYGSFKEFGSLLCQETIAKHFPLKLSKDPVWLTDKLVFLGEIKRKFDFEEMSMGDIVVDGKKQQDKLLDDSALAYCSDQGLLIIVGCAHAGICNTIEHAKKICNQDKVIDIIGGTHLCDATPDRLQKTVQYIKDLNLQSLHACHCTGLKAQVELAKVAPIEEVGVGFKLEY